MALKITLSLEDKDLKYFRRMMTNTQKKIVNQKDEASIIVKARETLLEASKVKVPIFVQLRLDKLESMLSMLSDKEWQLHKKERANLLTALAYFVEPADLIHDEIPVLGFLDDAIIIELVVRELQHEIDAYEDFCGYRDGISKVKGSSELGTREEWLSNRRTQLHSRMRRRRSRMHARIRRSNENKLKVSLF